MFVESIATPPDFVPPLRFFFFSAGAAARYMFSPRR
jgi:hypothetical protein